MAEWSEMPFGMWTQEVPKKPCIRWGQIFPREGALGGSYLCMPRFAHSQYTQLHSLAAAAVLATGVFQQVVDNDV